MVKTDHIFLINAPMPFFIGSVSTKFEMFRGTIHYLLNSFANMQKFHLWKERRVILKLFHNFHTIHMKSPDGGHETKLFAGQQPAYVTSSCILRSAKWRAYVVSASSQCVRCRIQVGGFLCKCHKNWKVMSAFTRDLEMLQGDGFGLSYDFFFFFWGGGTTNISFNGDSCPTPTPSSIRRRGQSKRPSQFG